MKMYSVFDSKALAFAAPFVVDNDDMAIRYVKTAVNSPGHAISLYPNDFRLMCIGDWDEVKGIVSSDGKGPLIVIDCVMLVDNRVSVPDNGSGVDVGAYVGEDI